MSQIQVSKCPNCNREYTCGCQRKYASNGKEVCSVCLESYENKLKSGKTPKKDDQTLTPQQAVYLQNTFFLKPIKKSP
jgi:hypothetical protein